MPTATREIPTQLAADITTMFAKLKNARADDDSNPNHNPQTCQGCYTCVLERQLDRLLDKLPRRGVT